MTHGSAHTKRTQCRLCNASDFDRPIELQPTPMANAYVKSSDISIAEPCFPLDVYVCRSCHHAQLLDIIDPSLLFGNYAYVSGTSPVYVRHLQVLCCDVLERNLSPKPFMVEIGSNDGTLLKLFKEQGSKVLGVEPAQNLAKFANENGLPTSNVFFNLENAEAIRREEGAANIICANHVLAHIDTLDEVFSGIRALLAKDGICVFEVSYLVDVIEKGLFDTIYHEHVSYHSVAPMVEFLEKKGLNLFAVERTSAQGGSVRFFVQQQGGPRPEDVSVSTLLQYESDLGLETLEPFRALSKRIEQSSEAVRHKIKQLKDGGFSVAGYGAPAKVTTLMHQFKLGTGEIDYIVDDNPLKQGLFTPGKHVPIVKDATIYDDKPDYLVIFAWNFARSIVEKHRAFLDHGGRFIVPLPELCEIGPETIDQYIANVENRS